MALKKVTFYLEEDTIDEMKIEKVKEKKDSLGQMVEEMWQKYKQEKNRRK